ncbi:hypothetical protein PACILC2_47490 [Paenibacillus cisolokensis]|uniref:Uncharacterized protein n=1 Tax=Paenibacillus cisolokensis TaxID=1658519 RepID=A0ABQ4NE85_9BACL|nr:hypothetical protein PACILC2_47490 [Paenibacillus cisolokensis]
MTVNTLRMSRKLPARYISWNMSAFKSIGPVVGVFRTIETIASPEISAGSVHPIVLISGLIAMRTGYLNRSLRSSTPLARAVMTYCLESSSSSMPRMTRIRLAVPDKPIMTTGSTRRGSILSTLSMLHGASWNSGENRPVIDTPVLTKTM